MVEQVVAPGDRSAQRALPIGAIARPAGEEVEALLQARQHRLRGEELDPRGRELDRERQPVEAIADLRHRRRVLGGDGEVGTHGRRALDEETHRVRLGEHLERRKTRRIGKVERRDGELLLSRDAQRRAARCEDLEVLTGLEQRGHGRGGGKDLLEIVEHEQQAAVADVFGEAIERRFTAAHLHADRVRDGGRYEVGIGDRGERDPERAVRVAVGRLGRELQREAGLAGASRPGEGQEAGLAEEAQAVRDLLFAADE